MNNIQHCTEENLGAPTDGPNSDLDQGEQTATLYNGHNAPIDIDSEIQEMALKQFCLFGQQPKPLTKIPFKFSYVFKCHDNEMPHNAMVEDWELGVLFLKETYRLGSEQKAAESVKNKYLNELCSLKRDTRLFMGTTFPYNSWVVLGVFYPKADHPKQMQLF